MDCVDKLVSEVARNEIWREHIRKESAISDKQLGKSTYRLNVSKLGKNVMAPKPTARQSKEDAVIESQVAEQVMGDLEKQTSPRVAERTSVPPTANGEIGCVPSPRLTRIGSSQSSFPQVDARVLQVHVPSPLEAEPIILRRDEICGSVVATRTKSVRKNERVWRWWPLRHRRPATAHSPPSLLPQKISRSKPASSPLSSPAASPSAATRDSFQGGASVGTRGCLRRRSSVERATWGRNAGERSHPASWLRLRGSETHGVDFRARPGR